MRALLLISVLQFFGSISSSQGLTLFHQFNLMDYSLNGKVKCVYESKHFRILSSMREKKDTIWEMSFYFDTIGNIERTTTCNYTGTIAWTDYSFYLNGLLVVSENIILIGDCSFNLFWCNTRGDIQTWRSYKKDSTINNGADFTSNCKIGVQKWLGSNGEEYARNEFEYDEDRNIIKRYSSNFNKKIFLSDQMRYDSLGNVLGVYRFSEKLSLTESISNEFDEEGRIIQSTSYGNDGKLYSKTTYYYDSRGNNINYKLILYTEKGNVFSTELTNFEYDEHNNWVKKSYSKNGNLQYYWNRQIDYY